MKDVPYLPGEPVHDRTDRHLAVSLDLGHEGLAEVEVSGVVQPHLTTSSVFSDLLMTSLLQLRLEGEKENGPGEGGGGGVGPGTEQIKDGHHQLVSIKLGVGSARPSHSPAIHRERTTLVFCIKISPKRHQKAPTRANRPERLFFFF